MTFPPLPTPGRLLLDNPAWPYPSGCAASGGMARLRVWAATLPTGQDGHLAIVTELGIGASITNSAERIAVTLARALPGPLAVLEHWPASESGRDEDTLDQITAHDGSPYWRPVSRTSPTNPHHAEHEAWMAAHGRRLLAHVGPPDGPALWGPHCDHDECAWAACDHTGRPARPCRTQPLGCPHCAEVIDTDEADEG